MQLTTEGIKDRATWKNAVIEPPAYGVEAVRAKSMASPRWAHFGIGNIFRIFTEASPSA